MQTARWCLALFVILSAGCKAEFKELHEIKVATNGNGQPAHHPIPIMQGITSSNQSRFMVLAPKYVQLEYYIRRPDRVERVLPARTERDFSDYVTEQFEVGGLKTEETYELIVIGPHGETWDQRKFHSLDLTRRESKILLVSCLDDHLSSVADKIWPEALAQKPDVIFMIGDNVYADKMNGIPSTADDRQIWTRYVQTWLALPVFTTSQLVPILATWDDHDYGANDSDRSFRYKDSAAATFFAFFPQQKPSPGFERGPGISSYWTAFGVHFAFLDDRSFRTPNQADLPDQSHFGLVQERWLQKKLQDSDSPTFLISGDQFFGGYHDRESFEGSHPANFKFLLSNWRQSRSPLMFLTGDRHLTEIISVPSEFLGYPTFEITSSPLHARVFPGELARKPNPRQLVGRDGTYNYSVIEIKNTNKNQIEFEVSAFTLEQKPIFQKTLNVRTP